MQLRSNRKTERAGINAVRSFLEAQDQVFQEVELGNDYGKDAYLDFTTDQRLLGVCAGLQIKSGASFVRASGYAIPVDGHLEVWKNSSVPILGIVHDGVTGDLYWVNITQYLGQCGDSTPTVIPVPAGAKLTPTSLKLEVLPSVRATTQVDALGSAALKLCDANPRVQFEAIGDCFALGRGDARVLLLVRNCLRSFRGDALRRAIVVMSHAVPHPDILVHAGNHVPDQVEESLKPHFVWTPDELATLFQAAPWSVGWGRGTLGQCLYHLLIVDSDYAAKTRSVIQRLAESDLDAAFAAFYMALFWSDETRSTFEAIVAETPRLLDHELIGEVEWMIDEFGEVGLS